MARSPLFRLLTRAAGPTRRDLLRGSAAAFALACAPRVARGPSTGPTGPPRRAPADAKIVVVGAGLAGLAATDALVKAGAHVTCVDLAARAGGRVLSAPPGSAGQVVELGAEFIDSDHEHVLALAREVGLELVDLGAPAEAALDDVVFVGGIARPEADVTAALRALGAKLAPDVAAVASIDHATPQGAPAAKLDHTPLDRYLDDLGLPAWMRALLDVAYVGEFGRQTAEQSAVNLLTLFDPARAALFGTSDERYRIRGGNEQLVRALGERVAGHVELERRLTRLASRGARFELSFERGAPLTADAVVLALPFTALRGVDLGIELPPAKRHVIATLGYGQNSKLCVETRDRPWRTAHRSGGTYSDLPFQTAWDATRGTAGATGTMTIFVGGDEALAVAKGTPASELERLLPGLERAQPGVAKAAGKVRRMAWSQVPGIEASYACYTVGQWSTLHGLEAAPVGRVTFAGEHTSAIAQGYMEGALESGARAANEVLAALA